MKNKRLFLLDMDGTIYLGDRLFDATIPFLEKVKSIGGRCVFLTNNSSKSREAYVDKLNKMGITVGVEDFLTSTDATILYIKKYYSDKKFYCMGTRCFVEQLTSSGINATTTLDKDIFGVLISNDTELSFKKLDDVSRLLTEGVNVYLATNPDWTCPTEYGYVPDCGSFAEILYRATGRKPVFIGKPKPEMVLLAMEKYGYSKQQTLMIGDRIYTDIAAGFNAGVDTALVLSGESTAEDADKSETKPTHIFKDIGCIINLL